MPVKPKTTTKTRKAKRAKKPAAKATAKKATAKKARKAKKPAAKKARNAKKPAAKKAKKTKASAAQKTAKQQGKPSTKKSTENAANKQKAKAPSERTAWRISPEISQSVVDIDIWKKDNLTIEHRTVYRSGWIIVHELPELSAYNPHEGVDIFEEFEFEEHEVLDGSQETSLFPKELSTEECERLMTLSEDELIKEGWMIESATRFTGPLVVEEV